MKGLLQIGPVQFVVEGASFHLLCHDIQHSLRTLLPQLPARDISLTLHVDVLERALADDAQRLRIAGVPLPQNLYESDEANGARARETEEEDKFYNNEVPEMELPKWRQNPHQLAESEETSRQGQHFMRAPLLARTPAADAMTYGLSSSPSRRLSVTPIREPLNIFSAESFDIAEAFVQELQTRVLEQRLLLAKCATRGTDEKEGEYSTSCGKTHANEADKSTTRTAMATAKAPVMLSNLNAEDVAVSRCFAPLPVLRLDPFLATSESVLPDYDTQGRPRRRSLSLTGASPTPPS